MYSVSSVESHILCQQSRKVLTPLLALALDLKYALFFLPFHPLENLFVIACENLHLSSYFPYSRITRNYNFKNEVCDPINISLHIKTQYY